MGKINARILLIDFPLDGLDFVIKILYFASTFFIESFVEKWHFFLSEDFVGFFWELFEEPDKSTWVNDLIAGT